MTEDPPPPPPYRKEGEPMEPLPFGQRRSALVLGVGVGVVCIGGLVLLDLSPLAVASGGFVWVLTSIAYLVTAAILAARPRTTLFGAGLLLAIGVGILAGAGVCVALVSGVGRITALVTPF